MSDVLTETTTKSKLSAPKRYVVILHNDDYTTMDFVVELLGSVFHKSVLEASQIAMAVHLMGKCVVAVYTKEVALSKVSQVIQQAEAAGFPLLATAEEA